MGQTNVHDGAMSQIVLWCDLEIDKFTEIFGGPHILGRLALVSTKTSGALSSSNYLSKTVYDQRNQLKAAEEIGNYAELPLCFGNQRVIAVVNLPVDN